MEYSSEFEKIYQFINFHTDWMVTIYAHHVAFAHASVTILCVRTTPLFLLYSLQPVKYKRPYTQECMQLNSLHRLLNLAF